MSLFTKTRTVQDDYNTIIIFVKEMTITVRLRAPYLLYMFSKGKLVSFSLSISPKRACTFYSSYLTYNTYRYQV